ncbi:MAG: ABC transporter permease [Beutenbergiaceae bacterium]
MTTQPVVRQLGAPIAGAFLLLGIWSLGAILAGPAALPDPIAVVRRLLAEVADGDVMIAAGATTGVSILGSALGLLVAFPLGYLMAHSRWAAAALNPYVAASQAIPAVAIAPLLALWFGYGLTPRALLCAAMVFFPILLNTVLGLTGVDSEVVDAARMDGADRMRLLISVQGPMALPALLTGIRNGFVLSVTGAVVGEFVIGGSGLGELLSIYRDRADTVGMFATLLVLAAIAVGFNLAIRGLERTLRWW